MKMNDKHIKHISEVWVVKEKIYRQTENMDFKQYIEYLHQNLGDLKIRFKSKYANTLKETGKIRVILSILVRNLFSQTSPTVPGEGFPGAVDLVIWCQANF